MFQLFVIWAMWMGTVILLAMLESTVLLNFVLWTPFIFLIVILIALAVVKFFDSKYK